MIETSLYVDDLAVARDFYQRVFGLATTAEDGRTVALSLPGAAVLLLHRRGGAEPGGAPGSGLGVPPQRHEASQHLCLAIPAPSLQDWERHLMVCGVVIESRVVQAHGGTSMYFRDPDGHSVEVATPGLWPES